MIGEREVVRGAIDGCLSILGVVIGAYGVAPSWLLSAALSGNFANVMSNLLAAFSAVSAQRSAHLRTLERSMLTELQHTEVGRAARRGAMWEALADGVATMLGGLVPVTPFFFFTGLTAISLSISSSLLVMLLLGAWSGRFSRSGMLLSGLKLTVLGILTVIACLVIHRILAPDIPML